MPTDEPNNQVGTVKITRTYFPTPAEALDLGWSPEKILADCRRMPKEDLTEELRARLLTAGLTPLQIKTLFPFSRRQLQMMRQEAQSFRDFAEGEDGDMKPEKKPEEPVKLTFAEGLRQGLSPRTALEVCEPARARDIRSELLQQCVDGGLTRDEIAKGFGTTLKMLNNTATKVRFKWPRLPRSIGQSDTSGQEGGEQPAQPAKSAVDPESAAGVFTGPAVAHVGEPEKKEAVSLVGAGVAAEKKVAAAHTPDELADIYGFDNPSPPEPTISDEEERTARQIIAAFGKQKPDPKPMVVYLAGAVDIEPHIRPLGWFNSLLARFGLTGDYDPIIGWRKYSAKILEAEGIKVIDTTRHLEAVVDAEITDEELVDSNMIDIQLADVMLVEMARAGHAYIGTAIDMRKAYERGIPIIVWGKANRASRYLHHHATTIVDDLDAALSIIKGLAIGMRWKGRKGAAAV